MWCACGDIRAEGAACAAHLRRDQRRRLLALGQRQRLQRPLALCTRRGRRRALWRDPVRVVLEQPDQLRAHERVGRLQAPALRAAAAARRRLARAGRGEGGRLRAQHVAVGHERARQPAPHRRVLQRALRGERGVTLPLQARRAVL